MATIETKIDDVEDIKEEEKATGAETKETAGDVAPKESKETEDKQTQTETPDKEDKEADKEDKEDKAGDPEAQKEQQVTDTITKAKEAEKEVKTLLSDKKVDFEALAKTYMDNGALSQADYDNLAKAGFSKTVVDAYIAGVEATSNKFTNAVMDSVGGKEEYGKVAKYIQGKGNECIDAYNALINNGNVSAIRMFLNGIKAEMTLKNGTSNPSVLGSASKGTIKGFDSEEDMSKALSDSRYGRDEDYTNKVALRLSKSSFVSYNR